jgi:hypothetical protein
MDLLDNSPIEYWTPGTERCLARESIGWDELREEMRQFVRDELRRQLQAIFRGRLKEDCVAA